MTENAHTIQFGGLVLAPSSGDAFLDGQSLVLTRTEFRLLVLLLQSDGNVFTRKQIIEAIQGPDYPVTDRSVDGHILYLRKKLGDYGRLIETVRGVGYRFRKDIPQL